LQGVAGSLTSHVAVREAVQFLINERGQLFEGSLVAVAPGDQKPRDVFLRVRPHKKPA
jgi:hypothetical protein